MMTYENEIKDMLTHIRAAPSDTILNVNRDTYEALKNIYNDRQPLFDIKTTGTVKDNVLYKYEVIIHE